MWNLLKEVSVVNVITTIINHIKVNVFEAEDREQKSALIINYIERKYV